MSTRKASNTTNRRFSPWLSPTLVLGVALLVCSTAAPAQAQTACPKEINSSASCGCLAVSSVSLKADMLCMDKDGIIVGANGITIRLNGFRIQCTDPLGYGMSCQGGTHPNNTGVKIVNRSNVTVRGSGAIQGFDTGILVSGGSYIEIEKLNITAPDADLGVFLAVGATPTARPDTAGILVQGTSLYSDIDIFANSVDNHTAGIRLENAKGVEVRMNFAHDNNGGLSSTFGGESHGVHLVDSTDNVIHNNLVVDNGVNVGDDSGIMLDGSLNNRVHGNNVSFSNGDGISVRQGSANNVIDNNVILYNTSNETIPSNGRIFFDLASKTGAGVNTFNTNNRCETESTGVPATVCNSGEGEAWTKKP